MATEIEAGRALVHKAAWLKDQGGRLRARQRMAKLYTGELEPRRELGAADRRWVRLHGRGRRSRVCTATRKSSRSARASTGAQDWRSLAISVCSGLALVLGGAGGRARRRLADVPREPELGVDRLRGTQRARLGPNFYVLHAVRTRRHRHPARAPRRRTATEPSRTVWRHGRAGRSPPATAMFGVTLKADAEPGVVTLQARQGDHSGAIVEWPLRSR